MMTEIRQTLVFEQWLDSLTDRVAVNRITQRIIRLRNGLMGDIKPVGSGVSEMRIDHGPGYRLYFVQKGDVMVILLCGGDKRFTGSQYREGKDSGGGNQGLNMETTKPFDPAKYMTEPEAQQELLDDAFASGNAAYIADALGIIARARGMTDVARSAGVTREALYKSLSEEGDPRLTTLLGVARALGVTLSARIS